MPPRPRRSAAQRASLAITDMADRDIGMASRSRRASGDTTPAGASAYGRQLRQSNGLGNHRDRSASHDVVHSRRPTRGAKKRYVESESSDEEDEVHVGGADDDDDDDDMDVDDDDDDGEEVEAEERDEIKVVGNDSDMDDLDEDDAEGDIDMDVVAPPPQPTIKITKPATAASGSTPRSAGRPAGGARTKNGTKPGKIGKSPNKRGRPVGSGRKRARVEYDDEDDEEEEDDDDDALSDADEETHASVHVAVSGEGDEADAEGDEIEVADDAEEDEEEDDDDLNDAEGDDDADGDSDGDEEVVGSRAGTPDLTKMTRRQRARFEEAPDEEYLKLSDEVQVKKHFTEEELSMRRAEMARRRRNLSEKRNEEVKAETINKLLKRQAPKTTKKNALGDEDADENGYTRPDPVLIRWISNRQGSRVAVPSEILEGPAGAMLAQGGVHIQSGKMVEEVV